MDNLTKGLIEHLRKHGSEITVREAPQFIPAKDFHPIPWEKRMSTLERNTHFQGSAQQVAYKILDLAPGALSVYSRDDQKLIAEIIAQYAYDLLEHASQFVMVSPEDIPDLTEWPTPESS